MIWLASFPRSGNTFFRNVLYEVYGIESSEYHWEKNQELKDNFDQYDVVKTHLLPEQLPIEIQSKPSVYLVRDGRDAIVSIAHHRKNIVAPGSNYYMNLLEAILAREGSFFGGWSENVMQWSKKADVIIRFEDLIKDPIREIEKLRKIVNLPKPNIEKLPTFESQKFGNPRYGSRKNGGLSTEEQKNHAGRFFRKGKIGVYKKEMPVLFRLLFWAKNRKAMKLMRY
ncbi:MAG TPA: sulfotransferase domain-containing protein [Saprospiraceae bacterium]|nr:sulfotransferase domain-containing protein [Saprospiraceae bacterium]